MTVAIADPHPAVASALVDMIESRPGFEVAGCASGAAGLFELLEHQSLSLLLLDQSLANRWPYGDLPGHTLLEHVRATYPSLAIIVLAMSDDPLIKARSLASGASAFLPKERIGDLLGHTLTAQAHPQVHPQACHDG
jgi:DNA-binding NarL/FixJ family response regulator